MRIFAVFWQNLAVMKWIIPALLATPAWLGLLACLRRGDRRRALLVVAVWAGVLGAGLPLLEWWFPGSCARLFPGAARYREAMLTWVQTGRGCEGTPACFVPQHLAHLVLFTLATVATAGLGGLAFGVVLFGWMGAYTGGLAQLSGSPLGLAVGWHPWATLRVAAFLFLGVALAEPLARWGLPPLPGRSRFLLRGLMLVAADLALKWLLAEWWRMSVLPSQ